MDQTTVVWGVGNEIMGDDAAGVRTAELIMERRIPWIRVSLCGVLPENHIAPLREISPGLLLVIDAADIGGRPGDIRLLKASDAAGAVFSSHGIPVGVLLAPFEKTTRIVIIAIQPQNIGLGEVLSRPVAEAVKTVADAVCDGTWEEFPYLHSENLSPR